MGWSCKEAAEVLDVSPTKVTQSLGPAMVKIAKLMLADPRRTMEELSSVMSDLNNDRHAFDSPEEKMGPGMARPARAQG